MLLSFLAGDKADEVIDDFGKRFNKPENWEGFTKYMHASTPEEVQKFVVEILAYPAPGKPGKAAAGKGQAKNKAKAAPKAAPKPAQKGAAKGAGGRDGKK